MMPTAWMALEGLGDPGQEEEHGVWRQRPVPADRLAQRQAGHVGRGQPGLRRVRIGLQHLRGEQAVHALCGGHLLAEPGPELLVVAEPGPDHLERDLPAARGQRQVDAAHRARAEPCAKPVPSDLARVVPGQRLNHGVLRLHWQPRVAGRGNGLPSGTVIGQNGATWLGHALVPGG